MTPEVIEQLKAVVEAMRNRQGGVQSGGSALQRRISGGVGTLAEKLIKSRKGGVNVRWPEFNITKSRIAEINRRNQMEAERLAQTQRDKALRYYESEPRRTVGGGRYITPRTTTQPVSAQSKTFGGHSRRGGGGGFIMGENILGSKADWFRRRYPRNRNLSEVYRPGAGLLA